VQFELAATLLYQTRLHILRACQCKQLLRIEQSAESGDCMADQQRFFLPVVAQELVDGQAAEQGKPVFHFLDYSPTMSGLGPVRRS